MPNKYAKTTFLFGKIVQRLAPLRFALAMQATLFVDLTSKVTKQLILTGDTVQSKSS